MSRLQPNALVIRPEGPRDFNEIDNVIRKAFSKKANENVEECDIVKDLRRSPSYIPSLSLVATINGQIIGHIMFTKALVGRDEVLCLAPLSVNPPFQKQGVGSALVNEGHRLAKKLGYKYSVVFGDPNYYQRFGYELAAKFGIQAPNKIPSKFLQAIKLCENAPSLKGAMTYPEAFGI